MAGLPERAIDESGLKAPAARPEPELAVNPQVNEQAQGQEAASSVGAAPMQEAASAPMQTRSTGSNADSPPADGTVHVAYVPDVVRNEITEEVKDEVIAQAHKEGWGTKVPEWTTRFDLYGDIRLRFEAIINHASNNDTGAFLNFNAVNTGSPYDISNQTSSNPYPTYNVNENRERERLRARLGAAIDMKNGFTVGLRLATGNDNNPVTENQTFGAAGNAQGGDFAKYSVWLDRAFLRYASSGDPSTNFSFTMGRFENPFFATNLLWANDLGFDGAVMKMPFKVHVNDEVVDSVKPFLVAGIFPVFNTDLNFGSSSPVKFASYDKWMGAAQAGTTWKLGSNFSFKSAAALYYYVNIQGQLSNPIILTSASESSNTDASRPSFAQNGNTYMAIRDITPSSLNNNGAADQWQYFGLASAFHDVAFTQEADFNGFEPFRISLIGEYVDNLAFNRKAVAAIAVNNQGTADAAGTIPFVGGNKGWLVTLKLGDAVLDTTGNWNFSVGYRRVESDSVVDAFTDADFGGDLTGTNLEGYTLTAAFALTHGVWIEGKWFSATAIAGPTFKNDTLQFDLNAKF